MNHYNAPVPALVAVNADHINQLSHRYAAYRQALAAPGDPMDVLLLTGAVLQAVRAITTAHPDGWSTESPGQQHQPVTNVHEVVFVLTLLLAVLMGLTVAVFAAALTTAAAAYRVIIRLARRRNLPGSRC